MSVGNTAVNTSEDEMSVGNVAVSTSEDEMSAGNNGSEYV
jgi:hypothetical protein